MNKRIGKQSAVFKNDIYISSSASIAGQKESEGPVGEYFDYVMPNAEWGETTWEKTESKMQRYVAEHAVSAAGLSFLNIDYIFSGDLLNQCIAAGFAFRDFNVPFFGVYGACSTFGESASLASLLLDGGFGKNILAVTSSHFCTAERQYRNPLEYGGQRTPTSQWTVTGAGALVLSTEKKGFAKIKTITTGKVIDFGIKDANNMGAAMAPAAVSTIKAHFEDTKLSPDYYDLILTGDLGVLGKELALEMLMNENINIKENYNDCGCLIFDAASQDMHSGGSGCGCCASVFSGYIADKLKKKELNRVLLVPTGALLSTTSSLQGESIPSVAHALSIETV